MGWFYSSEPNTGGLHVQVYETADQLYHIVFVCTVLPPFLIGTTITLLTEPISLGSAVALLSKKLKPEVQGMCRECIP